MMRHTLVSALAATILAGSGGLGRAAITRTLKTSIPLHISIWTAPAGQRPPFGLRVHVKPGEAPRLLDKKGDWAVLDPAGTYALDFNPPDSGERQFELLMIEEYPTPVARPVKQYHVLVTVTPAEVSASTVLESKAYSNCPAVLTIGTKPEPSPLFSFDPAPASR